MTIRDRYNATVGQLRYILHYGVYPPPQVLKQHPVQISCYNDRLHRLWVKRDGHSFMAIIAPDAVWLRKSSIYRGVFEAWAKATKRKIHYAPTLAPLRDLEYANYYEAAIPQATRQPEVPRRAEQVTMPTTPDGVTFVDELYTNIEAIGWTRNAPF